MGTLKKTFLVTIVDVKNETKKGKRIKDIEEASGEGGRGGGTKTRRKKEIGKNNFVLCLFVRKSY